MGTGLVRVGMIRLFLPLLLIGLASSMPLAPAAAHEAHRRDMSDAEMAMEKQASQHVQAAAMHHPIPSGEALQASSSHMVAGSTPVPMQAADTSVPSLPDLLGRLHPFAAHFPMALLLVALLAELAFAVRPTLGMETTVRFLVAGGAIGAVTTALFGWFSAGWRLADRSETLGFHRWNGTAIAVVSLIAWWAAAKSRRGALRVLLALLAAAVLTQGYLGGEMVFGPNHLGM